MTEQLPHMKPERFHAIRLTLLRVAQGRGGPAEPDSAAGIAEELFAELARIYLHEAHVAAQPSNVTSSASSARWSTSPAYVGSCW